MEQKCANCGYCPTCGRGNQPHQVIWYAPEPGEPWNYPAWTSPTASTDITDVSYTTS